ncbi:MAG: lysostaphin resistance A-like protein [Spiroplasma sp.]
MIESTIKTVKSKSKLNDLCKKYFTSKEISSNHDYPFNFKNANWYVTIVYLVSFIVIPIIYSLIKNYVFHVHSVNDNLPSPWIHLEPLIMFLVPIIGMAIGFAVDWHAMTKRGAWAAYTLFIFGFIGISLSNFIEAISKKPTASLGFLVPIIIQFIGSLIVIFTNKSLRKQIIATLKEAKLDLLTWILIFLAICSWLNFIFKLVFDNIINSSDFLVKNDSINQKVLKSIAKTPLGIFALILGVIFLAPINEEISCRYGIFSIVRHKWVAFTASLVYFPAMHVMNNGDWNHFFSYLAAGTMFPLLFICTRGNTTYTIGLHMLWNTVALIQLVRSME